MTADPERALERMRRVMLAVAAAGVVAALIRGGWKWAAGWMLGAAASMLNYHWLRRATEAIGAVGVRRRRAVFFGSRYLLLGGGAYVILEFTAISLPAALAGLFVPVVAVVVEILIQLMYARD